MGFFNKKKSQSSIENELSEIAKKFNIRVSSPYGYYPEDVDAILLKLTSDVSALSAENKKLSEDNDRIQKDLNRSNQMLTEARLQISLMPVQDYSVETSIDMISAGMKAITGNYDSYETAEDMQMLELRKQQELAEANKPKTTLKLNLSKEDKNTNE